MLHDFYQFVIVGISRIIAKIFLFIALSVSTPTINAMRSLNDQEAIVIVMDSSFRRRERSLIRHLGYQPVVRFTTLDQIWNAYV